MPSMLLRRTSGLKSEPGFSNRVVRKRKALVTGVMLIRGIAGTCCLFLIAIALSLIPPGIAHCDPPARIISLAPNITEILYDLGLEDRVVAVTSYCNYPPRVEEKPRVGGFSNPSLEAIVAMRPDLVIMTDDGNPREISERLRKLSIPFYVFRAARLNQLPGELRRMGEFLGVKKGADRTAKRIERTLSRYRDRARKIPGRGEQSVLFIVQPDPLIVAGPGTAIDDSLKLLGARNIASDAGSRYPKYSFEEVVRRSPDVIFIGQGHRADENVKGLLKRWNVLDAVKGGRVYYVSDSLFRLGPRIAEGIREMAIPLAGK